MRTLLLALILFSFAPASASVLSCESLAMIDREVMNVNLAIDSHIKKLPSPSLQDPELQRILGLSFDYLGEWLDLRDLQPAAVAQAGNLVGFVIDHGVFFKENPYLARITPPGMRLAYSPHLSSLYGGAAAYLANEHMTFVKTDPILNPTSVENTLLIGHEFMHGYAELLRRAGGNRRFLIQIEISGALGDELYQDLREYGRRFQTEEILTYLFNAALSADCAKVAGSNELFAKTESVFAVLTEGFLRAYLEKIYPLLQERWSEVSNFKTLEKLDGRAYGLTFKSVPVTLAFPRGAEERSAKETALLVKSHLDEDHVHFVELLGIIKERNVEKYWSWLRDCGFPVERLRPTKEECLSFTN